MSTRYLRKVYGNDIINDITKDHDPEVNDVESIGQYSKKQSFNSFNLLIDGSDNDEPEKYEKSDEEETSVIHNEDVNTTSKRKKKKKKKSGKAEATNCSNKDIQEDEITDEIDKTVREVNKLLGAPVACCSTNNDVPLDKNTKESIIFVQHKFLNAENELKRKCGSKIVSNTNKNRNRGRIGHFRKTWLTSLNTWFPVVKSGLSMSVDTTIQANNVQYFVYEHSSTYRQAQEKFFNAVETQQAERIVDIINNNPHHVDALLQFADLCKLSEDLQMSAEFVERAVHCLECAFHPLFNLTSNCRLSYKKQTNRALFIALFKHTMFIGGRACYRTSLELCKALLSFDPENDPLAIVLAIDFYALRAKEYEWFIDFCDLWETSRNLTQLPNIAYSLALAHFHLGHGDVADELLQNALIMFPMVLLHLLDKCGVSPDTRVLGHSHFNHQAKATTSIALEKLQNLYVVRSFHLWKETTMTSILPWLEKAAHVVMDRVDARDDYVAFCSSKRATRYQGQLPRNILRHIILSDIKEITITHPGVTYSDPIFSYDPLPPIDSIDIYTRSSPARRPSPQDGDIFMRFFTSFFMDLEGNPLNAQIIHGDSDEEHEVVEFD